MVFVTRGEFDLAGEDLAINIQVLLNKISTNILFIEGKSKYLEQFEILV